VRKEGEGIFSFKLPPRLTPSGKIVSLLLLFVSLSLKSDMAFASDGTDNNEGGGRERVIDFLALPCLCGALIKQTEHVATR